MVDRGVAVLRLLEELLPLDEERLGEVLVWLAFLARARWTSASRTCDSTDALEAQAGSLHTFVDGLTL